MKAHLAKVSLALLSAVFLLGCQDMGSGPVGPGGRGPEFAAKKCTDGPTLPGCGGGNDDGGAGGTVDLFLSLGFNCDVGATTTTTAAMRGQVIWENIRRKDSHTHATVQLTGVANGTYLIRGNQDTDGLCSDDGSFLRRSHSTSVTVVAGSGEARIGFTFGLENEDGNILNAEGHAPGAHQLWLTMTGPFDDNDVLLGGTLLVVRSVAIEFVLKDHKGHPTS